MKLFILIITLEVLVDAAKPPNISERSESDSISARVKPLARSCDAGGRPGLEWRLLAQPWHGHPQPPADGGYGHCPQQLILPSQVFTLQVNVEITRRSWLWLSYSLLNTRWKPCRELEAWLKNWQELKVSQCLPFVSWFLGSDLQAFFNQASRAPKVLLKAFNEYT